MITSSSSISWPIPTLWGVCFALAPFLFCIDCWCMCTFNKSKEKKRKKEKEKKKRKKEEKKRKREKEKKRKGHLPRQVRI